MIVTAEAFQAALVLLVSRAALPRRTSLLASELPAGYGLHQGALVSKRLRLRLKLPAGMVIVISKAVCLPGDSSSTQCTCLALFFPDRSAPSL